MHLLCSVCTYKLTWDIAMRRRTCPAHFCHKCSQVWWRSAVNSTQHEPEHKFKRNPFYKARVTDVLCSGTMLSPGSGARYCDERVCMFIRTSQTPNVQTSRNFLHVFTVAVAQSSYDNALRYVLEMCTGRKFSARPTISRPFCGPARHGPQPTSARPAVLQ